MIISKVFETLKSHFYFSEVLSFTNSISYSLNKLSSLKPKHDPQLMMSLCTQIHGGESQRYESVTFRLAQRRCGSCVRQNSDSSTGSGHPLLTPLPRRPRPSSEPSTPRHCNNNDSDEKTSIFKVGVVNMSLNNSHSQHKIKLAFNLTTRK